MANEDLKTLEDKLSYAYDTKIAIHDAIVAKGVDVPEGTVFREYANLISSINTAPPEPPAPEYHVYGVKIEIANSNPESACTYIEDAAGMSAGWNNWKDTDLFSSIKPCILRDGEVVKYLNRDNYTKYEDGSTATLTTLGDDVMVEIPKIGYKMETDGSYHYIYVTDNPNAEGYCYAAHSKNTEGDCDKIYIGAYLAYDSAKLYSASGKSPAVDTALTNFRKDAEFRGDGYELFSFYPLTLLQCLYMIIYKNRNSQTALGAGRTYASAKANTGNTNSNTFCYGSSSGTTRVKFLGIEDFYGNLYQWIDGIYSDSSRNIRTYYKNFEGTDNGSNYQYTVSSGLSSNTFGYISDIQGTNHGGFVIKAKSGSSSTYYTDYAFLYDGRCAYFGGDVSRGAGAGAFLLHLYYSASSPGSNVGARLMYKHLAQ